MATAILDLYFVKGQMGPSNAQVTIKSYSTTEGGLPLLTPQAASLSEFEGYIGQIRKDLDELERKARRKFSN